MPAGTGCCRCRWAGSTATRSSAAITASSSTLGPLHLHAGPEDDQSVGLRACLSGRRAAPARLGVARRSGARGSRPGAGFPLERRHGVGGEGGTFYSLKCDYRLVIDNLMDLTHETYVHAGSIGARGDPDSPFDVTHTDRTATVTRWMIDIDPPPFWAKQLGQAGPPRRPVADHLLPGALRRVGDVGVARHRHGRAARRSLAGRERRIPRCHHAGKRDVLPLFLEFRPHLQDGRRGAHAGHHQGPRQRRERRLRPGSHVLEAQQQAIDRNPRMPFYNLNIDAGALWARRLIDGLLAREHAPPPSRIARPLSSRAMADPIEWRAPCSARPAISRPMSGCSRSRWREHSFPRRPAATSTSPCRLAAARTRGPIRSSAPAKTACIVSW